MIPLSPPPRPAAARPHPALALAVLVGPPLVVAIAATHALLYDDSDPLCWTLAMATIWPLLLRHRAPVPVFWLCWAAAVGSWALGSIEVPAFAVLVAFYTVVALRGARYAATAAVAVEAGVVLVALQVAPPGSLNDAVIILTGLAAAVFLLGTTMRNQRRYLASVEDRAQRLEQERLQQQQLAAATERARIAREMHDIVAHGLVVVIALSEAAAATAGTDPEAARGQMLQSASTGRQSLAGMRRLLGMLRADDGADDGVDLAPQPDLDALPPLVEETRRTGLEVRLTETGSREALSAAAQTTVYRIVQESLTNVVKHAPDASRADVVLHCGRDLVRFCITDDGWRVPSLRGEHRTAIGAGDGLTGMRERAAMFDGELYAGPTTDGWAVAGELRLEDPR